MARTVVVHTTCDNHPDDAPPVAATISLSLAIGERMTAKTLDFCGGCYDALVSPLEALYIDRGAPLDGKGRVNGKPRISVQKSVQIPLLPETRAGREPAKGRDWVCLFCDLTYASETGYRKHIGNIHLKSQRTPTMSEIFGRQCPLCSKEFSSLGAHAVRAHEGCTNSSELFTEASKQGDPHGIVKSLLERAKS